MTEIWRQWCRLCAGQDNIKSTSTNEQRFDLFSFIDKHLSIQIKNDEYTDFIICNVCYKDLSVFNAFTIRCEKVQTLFNVIFNEKPNQSEFYYKELRENRLNSEYENENKSVKNKTRKTNHRKKASANVEALESNICIKDEVDYDINYFDDYHSDNDEVYNVKSLTEELTIKDEEWQPYNDPPSPKSQSPIPNAEAKKEKTNRKCTNRGKNLKRGDVRVKKCRNLKEKRTKYKLPYVIEKGALSCHICGESFPIHNALVRHMPIHYPNFICDCCAKVFDTKWKLMKHLLIHQAKKFKCHLCGKLYKGNDSLRTHIQRHSKYDFYKCLHCSQRFQTYTARLRHLIKVHDETPTGYKCKQCDKVFLLCSGLTRHVKRIHLQEKPHVCSVCNSSFFTATELKNHMRKHTGDRNFKCTVCFKSFGRKYTLGEHMKIHNNEKRFVCPFCGRAFTQKCTLKGHLKTHEKSTLYGDLEGKDVNNTNNNDNEVATT